MNEPIICDFCGQTVMCDRDLQEHEVESYTLENCKCDRSKSWRAINTVCGQETASGAALQPDILHLLKDNARYILMNDIASVTVKVNADTQVKMTKTAKGKFSVSREDKEKTTREV